MKPQAVHFRPFTSEAYPALTQLTTAYLALEALVNTLRGLTHFGKAPGMVNPDPLDEPRTKNGKVVELAIRVKALPALQESLRSAIEPVQTLIDAEGTDPDLIALAEFNVWGASTLLQDCEHLQGTATEVLRLNHTKARTAIAAAYNVAVRTTTGAAA